MTNKEIYGVFKESHWNSLPKEAREYFDSMMDFIESGKSYEDDGVAKLIRDGMTDSMKIFFIEGMIQGVIFASNGNKAEVENFKLEHEIKPGKYEAFKIRRRKQ